MIGNVRFSGLYFISFPHQLTVRIPVSTRFLSTPPSSLVIMADIENIPRTTDLETAVNFAAEDGVSPEPHDEHEAFVVVEEPVTQDEIGSPADGAVDDDVINQIVMQEATQPGDTPNDAAPATKPEVTKKLTAPKAVLKTGKEKPVISAKAVATRSAPPTPTVKKVCLPHLSLTQFILAM